jgi:acyl-CoA thioester hydrolase
MDAELKPLAPFERVITQHVAFRDTDMMGHVNHAVYATWMESARVFWFARHMGNEAFAEMPFVMGDLYARYIKPVYFGQNIESWVAPGPIGRRSFKLAYEIKVVETGEVAATGWSTLVMFNAGTGTTFDVPDTYRAMVARLAGEQS